MSLARGARVTYRWGAWLFVACVIVQFFLAGLAIFADEGFDLHRSWGYTFGWITLLLIAAAVAGRMPRRAVGGALLLLVLFFLQSILVALRPSLPVLAALHPVNALAIFWGALMLARASAGWQGARQVTGAPAREATT
jgi:hypothetical protein